MTSSGKLAGRTAIVTGASRGIGLRIARSIVREGGRVALLARASRYLEDAAREIGTRGLAVTCDVGVPDQIRMAFAAISEWSGGKLDILVNNAGLVPMALIEQSSDAALRTILDINLLGPTICIREAIPLMRVAGGGDIINISSEVVRMPYVYMTMYGATKAGLEALSRGLRYELQPDKIRVSILRSGRVIEGTQAMNWDPDLMQKFLEAHETSGGLRYSGMGISAEITAQAVIDILALPREAIADLYELRSA